MYKKIKYNSLNHRQKENYNFQIVSGILASYGYNTIRLSDDYNSADFIAIHIDGDTILKVQLKGRISFEKKYMKKDLWICGKSQEGGEWYLYPHDKILEQVLKITNIKNTSSWIEKGGYNWPKCPIPVLDLIDKYKI